MKSEKSARQRSDQEQPKSVKLKVGWEKFSAIAHELRHLFARQHAEVGADFEPFAPNWELYLTLERAGSCAVWTARTLAFEGGEPNKPESWAHKAQPAPGVLVGYIIWLTSRGLHAADTTFGNADLIYLTPEYREGMTGYKLVKSGIAAIRPMVDIVRIETNDLYENGRLGLLLKRLKFRRIGSVYEH